MIPVLQIILLFLQIPAVTSVFEHCPVPDRAGRADSALAVSGQYRSLPAASAFIFAAADLADLADHSDQADLVDLADHSDRVEHAKQDGPVVVSDTIAAGLVHYHITDRRGPWNINVLEADLTVPAIRIKVAKASNGEREALFAMERTSSMVRRYSGTSKVGGAVNADFYNMENGMPVNLQVTDGVPLRRPVLSPGRSAFLVFEDGTPDIRIPEMQIQLSLASGNSVTVNGVNEARVENGMVLYNRYYGNSTGSNRYGTEVMLRQIDEDRASASLTLVADSVFQDRGNTAIHEGYYVLSAHGSAYNRINRSISAGDTVRISYHFNSERPIAQAAGGLPRIVCEGMDCVDVSAEKENVREAFITTRHPRTAIGISEDRGRLYLVTVDGRQQASAGMSLYELASLMTDLGAWDALNLDGGGSTTLVAGTEVANLPSDPTGERPVSNAILLLIDDE
ncbi:MAG: phosphodiester glycosidase family protein [Cyclonatronaceae bacterium]